LPARPPILREPIKYNRNERKQIIAVRKKE